MRASYFGQTCAKLLWKKKNNTANKAGKNTVNTRKYLLCGYFLSVLKHTTTFLYKPEELFIIIHWLYQDIYMPGGTVSAFMLWE